jgi:hypothetical protein
VPKKTPILIVILITSFWFWVVSKNWITGDVLFSKVSVWLTPLILVVVLTAFTALAFLLLANEKFWYRWSVSWITGLTYLFVFGFSLLNLAAIAGLALIQLISIRVAKIEINERIKLHVGLALRRAMPAIIIPLLLAVSFAYYETGVLERRVDERDVPVSFREAITKTVNTFLEDEAEQESEENGFFKGITEQARESTIDRAFDFFVQRFYDFTDKYRAYIPPILAFGLFLILWSVSFIFVYLSLGFAMIIYYILRATRFVTLREVDARAQRLIL